MKENNKLDSEKSNQLTPSRRNASGGFAFGKLLAGLVAAGVLGGGLFGGKHLLTKEEEKVHLLQHIIRIREIRHKREDIAFECSLMFHKKLLHLHLVGDGFIRFHLRHAS